MAQPGLVPQVHDQRTQKVEVRRSWVQSHPGHHSEVLSSPKTESFGIMSASKHWKTSNSLKIIIIQF